MPKTPESGGIPLPPSWPPFTRDIWDDRAEGLLESLGRMGHELEGYVCVPAVHSVGDYVPPKPAAADAPSAASSTTGGGEKPPVKPTKPLITYEQRRKFITKTMDLHRHAVGGGRSGRRGRAECVAFLRYTLEKLDEQQQEAMEEGDDETVMNIMENSVTASARTHWLYPVSRFSISISINLGVTYFGCIFLGVFISEE